MRKTLKVQKSTKVVNGQPCYDLLEAGVVVGTFITEEKALTAMSKRRFYNSGEQSALKHGFTPDVMSMHKTLGEFAEIDGI